MWKLRYSRLKNVQFLARRFAISTLQTFYLASVAAWIWPATVCHRSCEEKLGQLMMIDRWLLYSSSSQWIHS